jgi:hypothetical protein
VDCNFFILSVDLWDGEGRQEQNLVMHPNTASAALSGSNANSPNTPSYPHHHQYMPIDNPPFYPNEYQGYIPHGGSSGYQPGYPPPPGFAPGSSSMHHQYAEDFRGQSPQSSGQFTRNLIGSLTASAFRLKDHKAVPGIWFILQDLSVRTEGQFKLKFSFFNLGQYNSFPLVVLIAGHLLI